MPQHYVKLWNNLLRSSILEENVNVRWLWIALLLETDVDGNVYGTPEALARLANLSLKDTTDALAILMAPDENSTTSEENGRRLLNPAPNHWFVVNYSHYRNIKDANEERQKTNARVRLYRERVKQNVTPGNGVTRDVALGNDKKKVDVAVDAEVLGEDSAHTTAVAVRPRRPKETIPPTLKEITEHCQKKGYTFSVPRFVNYYDANGWKVGRNPMKSWTATCAMWQSRESAPVSPRDGERVAAIEARLDTERPHCKYPSAFRVYESGVRFGEAWKSFEDWAKGRILGPEGQ